MARITKVYTKTGDKGETSLVGGTRVKKSDLRIDLYGEVDHLNSFLGSCVTNLKSDELVEELELIQNLLFDLGGNFACEAEKREQFKLPQFEEKHVKWLETRIDEMNKSLPELKNFILPGGSQAGAMAHICRTTCRKVERLLIEFVVENPSEAPKCSQEFLNRLSDYFFVLARYINKTEGKSETTWSIGKF